MINGITSNGIYSSLKYTGSPITEKFKTTSVNQELVLFEAKDSTPENVKIINSNSITLTSGTSELYYTIATDRESVVDHDFTGDPVFWLDADSSVNISGINMVGIKFSGLSGLQYLINALSY